MVYLSIYHLQNLFIYPFSYRERTVIFLTSENKTQILTPEFLIEELKKLPGKPVITKDGKAMLVRTTSKSKYPGFDTQWFNAPGWKDKFKALGGGVGRDALGEWTLINLWTPQEQEKPVEKPAATEAPSSPAIVIPPDVISKLKPSQIPAVAHLCEVLQRDGHALDASGTGVGIEI